MTSWPSSNPLVTTKFVSDLLTQLDIFLLDLLVGRNRQRKRTLLVSLDRRLRHHQRRLALRRFQDHRDIGPGQQADILVVELSTEGNGARGRIHLIVDIDDLAGLAVFVAIGKDQADGRCVLGCYFRRTDAVGLNRVEILRLTDGKIDIDRRQPDEPGQGPLGRAHHFTDTEGCLADLSRERGRDIRIAQVEFCLLKV